MIKNVYGSMFKKHPAALAIVGWLAFVFGIVAQDSMTLRLLLLSAARVLP